MKHRISPRHPTHDYTCPGRYFITINTKHRKPYFGKIVDHTLILSKLGEYTRKCRQEIPQHYPSVIIDEFICMPDHIHGILHISARDVRTLDHGTSHTSAYAVRKQNFVSLPITSTHAIYTQDHGISHTRVHGVRTKHHNTSLSPAHGVRTQDFASLQVTKGPKSKSLGSIIRGFKIGVTKYANNNNLAFQWQGRYHDHIIRNQRAYQNIKQYIKNNPKNRNK